MLPLDHARVTRHGLTSPLMREFADGLAQRHDAQRKEAEEAAQRQELAKVHREQQRAQRENWEREQEQRRLEHRRNAAFYEELRQRLILERAAGQTSRGARAQEPEEPRQVERTSSLKQEPLVCATCGGRLDPWLAKYGAHSGSCLRLHRRQQEEDARRVQEPPPPTPLFTDL